MTDRNVKRSLRIPGGTQDPKHKREPHTGNGSSTQGSSSTGTRVATRGICGVVQGESRARWCVLYYMIYTGNAKRVFPVSFYLFPYCPFSFFRGTCSCLQLETDYNLLIPKARTALTRYGHQVVVANDLHHRKQWVILVERTTEDLSASMGSTDSEGTGSEYRETRLELDQVKKGANVNDNPEIEELIVDELVQRHDRWISAA